MAFVGAQPMMTMATPLASTYGTVGAANYAAAPIIGSQTYMAQAPMAAPIIGSQTYMAQAPMMMAQAPVVTSPPTYMMAGAPAGEIEVVEQFAAAPQVTYAAAPQVTYAAAPQMTYASAAAPVYQTMAAAPVYQTMAAAPVYQTMAQAAPAVVETFAAPAVVETFAAPTVVETFAAPTVVSQQPVTMAKVLSVQPAETIAMPATYSVAAPSYSTYAAAAPSYSTYATAAPMTTYTQGATAGSYYLPSTQSMVAYPGATTTVTTGATTTVVAGAELKSEGVKTEVEVAKVVKKVKKVKAKKGCC